MIHFRGHDFPEPKTRAELKKRIAQVLGVQVVPQEILETLDDEAHMSDALHPRDGRRGTLDCLARACELAEEHPELSLPPVARDIDRSARIPASLLSEGDDARSRLFADHVASVARRHKDVKRLRKELLGGRLLKLDQVRRLLSSLAAQMLSPETFKANGVPLLGHTSTEVNVDPAEAAKTGIPTRIKIEWEGRVGYVDLPEHWYGDVSRRVPAIAEDGHLIHYPARGWSVLDVIGELAESLASAHPWELQDAVIFLLTDKAPRFRPVSVRTSGRWTWDYHYGLITLTIAPWVAARDVQAIYQRIQRESFGRPLKSCSADKIELYRSVKCQIGRRKRRPPMSRLMKAWNKAHPGREYLSYRLFGKDYERVERWVEDGVLYPKFKILGGVGKQPDPEPQDAELNPAKVTAGKSKRAPRRSRSLHGGSRRTLKVNLTDER